MGKDEMYYRDIKKRTKSVFIVLINLATAYLSLEIFISSDTILGQIMIVIWIVPVAVFLHCVLFKEFHIKYGGLSDTTDE